MRRPDTKYFILGQKEARIIELMSKRYGWTLEEALDIYYTSITADLIHEGVADMHCRSDGYLAEEVWLEVQRRQKPLRLNDGDGVEYNGQKVEE